MEAFYKKVKFQFNKSLNEAKISELKEKLREIEGMGPFEITSDFICTDYLPFKLSPESIKIMLQKMGYPIKLEKKRKSLIASFIDKLAKSNKETFGSQRLNCCDISQN